MLFRAGGAGRAVGLGGGDGAPDDAVRHLHEGRRGGGEVCHGRAAYKSIAAATVAWHPGPMRIFRVTVRGWFDGLDDERRAALLAVADDHDVVSVGTCESTAASLTRSDRK